MPTNLPTLGEGVATVAALINAVDDGPMKQAQMWVDEPAEDGMGPYKRLAAAVMAQLATDRTRAAVVNLEGTLQALARLSASEECAVWTQVLEGSVSKVEIVPFILPVQRHSG